MTEIAHGTIGIDVDDDSAIAGLRRVDAEFARAMDKINRQKATATAELETKQLDQDVKNAQRKIRELEGKKASVQVDGRAFKRLEKEIAQATKDLKKLDGKRATLEIKVKGQDQIRKAEEANQKALEATQRELDKVAARRLKQVQAEIRADKQRVQQFSRSSAALRRQKDQELRASERAAYAEHAARTQAERDTQRQVAALPKLREEYVKLARDVENYDIKRRKAGRSGDAKAVLLVDIQQENALSRMKVVKEELEQAGSPIDLDVHVNPGQNFGLLLRRSFQSGGVTGAAYIAGASIGDSIERGLVTRVAQIKTAGIMASITGGLGGAASRGLGRLGSLAEGLSRATVRLGPFTASIKGALGGLAVLGPTLVSVVGALGSVVGVVGSAGLGLGALGTAVVGGAIPAFVGMFAVIKPVTEQFGKAMKASDAYQQAVSKHGKGSEQAAKKMKEMRQVLKGVDEETVKNFKAAGNLSQRWEKLTAPARASAFKVIGDGLKFASDNAGWFGRQTNRGMDIAQKSISRMIKGLGSSEGKNILGSMMSNFNTALGPALDGLANIGTYLGRVGRIASGFLPGMTNGFKNWSQNLADGGKNSEVLGRKVKGTIDSLRSVGRFAMSGGRLLKSFFGGGVESGTKLVDTMTNAMNRWTAFLNTTKGQNSLKEFFDRAVNGTQALYGALAPVISSFVGWASAVSPIVTMFFRGAGAVANFVASILRLTALQGPITALAATLGALWAVGKIGAAVTMVGNFTRALLGLKAAQTGVAAASGASGLAGMLGGAAGGAGLAGRTRQIQQTSKAMTALNVAAGAGAASQIRWGAAAGRAAPAAGQLGTKAAMAAGSVGLMRGAATALIPAIGGLGAVAGGAATAGVGLVAAAAVYGAYKLVTMKSESDKAKESLKTLGAQSSAYRQVAAETGNQMGDLGSQFSRSKIAVQQTGAALRNTKKGTQEHKLALMDHRDALRMNEQASRAWSQVTNTSEKANAKAVSTDRKREQIGRKLVQMEKERSAQEGKPGGRLSGGPGASGKGEQEKAKRVAELRAQYRQLTAEVERNKNTAAAASVNVQRGLQGGANYAGKAAQQVGAFTRQFDKLTKGKASKLAISADTTKAGAGVAKISNQLARVGQKKTAVNIVSNSKNAEQALARLQKAKLATKKLTIVERGGKEAVKVVEQLAGKKLNPKQQAVIMRGGAQAVALLNKILGLNLKTKTQRIMERGGNAVMGIIGKIIGKSIPGKTAALRAKDGASGIIRGVIGLINSVPSSKTTTITTQYVTRGSPSKGRVPAGGHRAAEGGVHSFAAGSSGTGAGPGMLTSPSLDRIDRAMREAEKRQPEDVRKGGRKISRPTLLTGEENRPEFVIATNPAYRERNIATVKQAARALGLGVSGNRGDLRKGNGEEKDGIIAAAQGYNPQMRVTDYSGKSRTDPKARTRQSFKKTFRFNTKLKGKKNRKVKNMASYKIAGNPWPKRLENLDGQQSDLERELSIRQSDIREPEDFLTETRDPATGDITYGYDQQAWDAWKPKMDSVRAVYEALIKVVTEISQSIPRARGFTNTQISGNRRNIQTLQARLKIAKKRAGSRNKKTKAEGAREVTRITAALEKEKRGLSTRREFMGGLREREEEAGFDVREYGIAIGDHDFEVGTKSRAGQADEIDAGNYKAPGDGGGGGGGGGGSSALSYGQQVAAASTEKANALREYGGNTKPTANTSSPTAGNSVSGPSSPAAVASPRSAAAAMLRGAGAGAAGASLMAGSSSVSGAAIGSLSGSGASARAASGSIGGAASPAAGPGPTQVTVNNTFATVPPDPHTFSKGVAFEIGAAL